MSVRNLSYLFKPRSVAVIGATDSPKAVGNFVMRNLLQGAFSGPIMPVNPQRTSVAGVLAYPDVDSLPVVPDLAVICTPPKTLPGLIDNLAKRGTRAAVVITSGLSSTLYDGETTVAQAMLDAAKPYVFRILGSNSLGLIVPGIGLNASFSHQPASKGRIAFVSQSGALCTTVLDWARPKNIGFSHFISLGDTEDVSFGDVLDYLGSDGATRSILLYIESITARRNFMSAARSAARNKPVVVIKAGRVAEGARAATSHTGALAGADVVYDSAFRRAGILRVFEIEELFAAVETLAHFKQEVRQAARLGILTNSGGSGVMAVDDLIRGGGRLAELSEDTISRLDMFLPPNWSRANPVDMLGDALADRYVKAIEVLCEAPEVDVVLCLHAPVAMVSATEVAQAIIDLTSRRNFQVLTCWTGGESVASARKLFNEAGLPTYNTARHAVKAFLHMVRHRRHQELLMQTPPSAPTEFTPDVKTARLFIDKGLASDNAMLSEPQANAVLSAYRIPTVETHISRTPEEAAQKAERMGGAVALKILSPDLVYKSDVGGVVLDLNTPAQVQHAATEMLLRVQETQPKAWIDGFTVQRMQRRPRAQELMIGVTSDPIFGPVILFGQGGTAVDVIGDRAVALPPLNMVLARDMISRTRVFNLLLGFRDRPPANIDAICLTLMQVAQLIIDFPEIVELDINPLFADSDGVLAVDARIGVTPATNQGSEHLAIRPYPKILEESATLRDGRPVLLRPIRPEDEPEHQVFLSRLSQEDIRYRFFHVFRELPHSEMARLTQIDYDREMAFIATAPDENGKPETLGVVRTITDPDNEATEFAIIARSDQKGQGLGHILMEKIIKYSQSRGTQCMIGQVLRDNRPMLKLADRLGFSREYDRDEGVYDLKLDLQSHQTPA